MTTFNDSIITNNFKGIQRINSSFSSAGISASDMQNVELFNTGINSGVGIRTMKGNTSVFEFQESDEKIISLYESVQKSEKYFFVYTETADEGKFYLYNPNSHTVTLKKSGLSVTGVSSGTDFAQGYSDLFVFTNGEEFLTVEIGKYNNESVLDEVTMYSLKDVENNDIKGLGLAVFDGRLWLFNGVRLWYSVKENCCDFATNQIGVTTSAGYIDFVKNITAIVPYLGTLAVFHKDSSALLSLNSDYSYSISDESPGGCSGDNALVFHGSLLFFYDDTKKAVFAFSQIVNGDKTLVDNLAKDVQQELMKIRTPDRLKMVSVINDDRNEIWLILPSESGYSTILIYDYIHSQWIKRKSQSISEVVLFSGNLYSASENKILSEYDGNDFDGEFIEAFYECAPLNLGVDNTLKVLYIPPRVTLDLNYQNDFMVQYIKNYDSIRKKRVKRIQAKTLGNLFYWDVSYWDSGASFMPKDYNSVKRLPTSCFQTLEMTFYTSESAQGFAIKNIELSNIKVKQI